MLGILKIFILSTNGKDVKRAILENRSTLSEDFRLILRYIEIDGSNDRHTAISIKAPPVPPNTSSWIVCVKAA